MKVANGLKTDACTPSNNHRIQHFIHEIRFDPDLLIPFLLLLTRISPPYSLIFDRKNWEYGKAKINFLMLSMY